MLRMEVMDQPHKIKRYVDKKTGEAREMMLQACDLVMPGARHPVEYEHAAMEAEELLPPGHYEMCPSSFYLGRYNAVKLGRIKWLSLG